MLSDKPVFTTKSHHNTNMSFQQTNSFFLPNQESKNDCHKLISLLLTVDV